MSETKLNGVIVGAGFFAGFHAEAWNRLSNVNIVAVADTNLTVAIQFAEQWDIPRVFEDPQKMLEEVKPDFVDIATRPDSHLSLVQLANQFGCHIICQKPMAPTLEESAEMVKICQDSKNRLIIHENWRWQPWYRAAKQAILDHDLGALFYLNFLVRTGDGFGPDAYTVQPYFTEMNRLLIFETLVHHLDTARFLAGEIESVFCKTQTINPKIQGEDAATIQISFDSGANGFIDGNRINGPVPAPTIFGILSMECHNGAVRVDANGSVWIRRYDQPEEQLYDYQKSEQGYRGDSVFAFQNHAIDSLIRKQVAESEAAEYLKTVRLVEACYESAKSGFPVDGLAE
ncbi:MAG: Gfo/Idh/MocA family oxidoreductase [Planctomycetota bacterium]